MDHKPSGIGLVLFGFYFLVYAGYIVINAFFPNVAGATGPGGVSVAISYGFGLIVLALVLAVVYLAKAKLDKS